MDLTSSLFSRGLLFCPIGFPLGELVFAQEKIRPNVEDGRKVLRTNCYSRLPVLSVGWARIHTESRGSERITLLWKNHASVDRLRIFANLTLVIFNSLYLFY